MIDAIRALGQKASTSALVERLGTTKSLLVGSLEQLQKRGEIKRGGTGPRNFHWLPVVKGSSASVPSRQSAPGEVVWNGESGRHVSLSSR